MRISDWSSDVCSSDLLGARIPEILADGFHRRHPAAVDQTGADQHLRTVTDRTDGLARLEEIPHEPESAFVGTQLVRVEDPARNDKGAVITRGGLVDRPVDPNLVSFLHMLEAPDPPVMRGHDMHSRPSLVRSEERPVWKEWFRT